MSYQEIESWLRDTVPGILVLGVIGSFLAYAISQLARKVLAPFLGRAIKALAQKALHNLSEPLLEKLATLYIEKASHKFVSYYALQLMKLLFYFFFSTCSLIIFLYALSRPDELLARPAVLIPLALTFLFLWWSLRVLMSAVIPNIMDFEKRIDDEIAKRRRASVG